MRVRGGDELCICEIEDELVQPAIGSSDLYVPALVEQRDDGAPLELAAEVDDTYARADSRDRPGGTEHRLMVGPARRVCRYLGGRCDVPR